MDFDARWAYHQFVQGVAQLPLPDMPSRRSRAGPSPLPIRPVLVDPDSSDGDDDDDGHARRDVSP